MSSKGIISREPTITCKDFRCTGSVVSLDGEMMGYIQKLTMEANKRNIVVERTLPKISGEGFEPITQSIVVENK